jgi:hypothetical protein
VSSNISLKSFFFAFNFASAFAKYSFTLLFNNASAASTTTCPAACSKVVK